MEIADQIKDIKTQFRLAMNGVASTQMREQGLIYKLNFGIELPRLRTIASEYAPNHELAQALWKENIRESKILAAMLMPVDRFCQDVADIWVEQIPTQEIAELTVMNLFARLPYASMAAFRWIADSREIFQVCGLLLLTRLCMQHCEFNESASFELVDQSITALQDENQRIALQAFILLRKYVQQGKAQRKAVQNALNQIHAAGNSRLAGWIEELQFECSL
ncbi:MAG: DNA alkylation repair protein [Bacteroidaceae bacterium]|nr:DNA alkylation repair protein [Bacteroidaceae bacterium]